MKEILINLILIAYGATIMYNYIKQSWESKTPFESLVEGLLGSFIIITTIIYW